MMLYECQIQYDVKPLSELEVYCRLERKDPLSILSIVEKEERKLKSQADGRTARGILTRLMGGCKA